MKIKDIIDEDGKALTMQQLKCKYNITVDIMQYNSIVRAIPKQWKTILRTASHTDLAQNIGDIIIEGKAYSPASLDSKTINTILTKRIQKPPTSLDKWIEEFPFLNDEDFRIIFRLPYKIVRDTKLQTFQYRLLNRILPCNDYLFKMKLSENTLCELCGHIENIEHLLLMCTDVKSFWEQLWAWTNFTLECGIIPSKTELLFGIVEINDTTMFHLSYIIIHAKWYIYRQKL